MKATLRLAFAVLLIGTLAIGVFSLTQISRLNASAQSIYDQGHVASRAAEEARGYVLRASRAQKMLLTATTAKERDELGADIDKGLAGTFHAMSTLQQYVDTTDADSRRAAEEIRRGGRDVERSPARLRDACEGAAARSVADELAGRHAGRVVAGGDRKAREDGRRSGRAARRGREGDDRGVGRSFTTRRS